MSQDVKITLVGSRTERAVMIPKGIELPEMKNTGESDLREAGGWRGVPSRSGRARAEWRPLLGSHQ